MKVTIKPGSTVVHRLSPASTRDDQRGFVVAVGEELRCSGYLRYCDVRWISPDGSADTATTRCDPSELEVIP